MADYLESFYRTMAHSWVKSLYRPVYKGFENIPERGGAIIISNHVSYMDGPLIDAGSTRPIRYVIDETIYDLPPINYFMRLNRAIPIAPNRKSVKAAFEEISAGLKAGDLICIFPEGFLTFTGGLGRFRKGIEDIIKNDTVPIIPISISGMWGSAFSRKFLGSWRRMIPRNPLQEVEIKCGKPIDPKHANVNYLQEMILKLKHS